MLSHIKSSVKRFTWATTAYRAWRDNSIAAGKAVPHPRGFRFIGPVEMQRGTFEPSETAFLVANRSRFEAFVNIGANCGYYVCIARQLGLHVVAIEPHPLNYGPLLRNMDVNGWDDVEVFPIALSARPGVMKLYGSGTGASLIPGWAQSSKKSYVVVPVSTLERVLGASVEGKKVCYWIDVEGAELHVLRGATRQLSLGGTWVVEISIADLQPEGLSVNPDMLGTFELFWAHGYQARNLDDGTKVEKSCVEGWQAGLNLIGGGNFIFER